MARIDTQSYSNIVQHSISLSLKIVMHMDPALFRLKSNTYNYCNSVLQHLQITLVKNIRCYIQVCHVHMHIPCNYPPVLTLSEN